MCGVLGAICDSAQAMSRAMCHASSRRPAKRVWSWMRCPMASVACGLNPSGRWATSRERRCRSRADLTLVPAPHPVSALHPVRADWEEVALLDWEEAALLDWEEVALLDWEEAALLDWEEVALLDWEEAALPDWEEVASAMASAVASPVWACVACVDCT